MCFESSVIEALPSGAADRTTEPVASKLRCENSSVISEPISARVASDTSEPAPRSQESEDDSRASAPRSSRRYLLISPCRDEEEYVRRTLESVASQSVKPHLWIIVDDGSSDGTPAILEEYARRLPFLRIVRNTDRGRRQVGPGVIEAFYRGLDGIDLSTFDYVCKLDVDLDLPPTYFEKLMQRMEENPRIGTTSGKPWFVHPRDGRLVPEICGDEMSVGMTKFYRVECFQEIGGFVRQVMWDGIDCHRARMLGWIAESVDDEALRFVHLRPQGNSQTSIWTGRTRAGFGQYFLGTSPLYYLAVAIYRLPAYPAVMGSLAMLWGYLRSWLKGLPRYDDPAFRSFLRSYQRQCLMLGKRRATAEVEAEREALWRRRWGPRFNVGPGRSWAPKARLLGLNFDALTMPEVIGWCVNQCKGPRTTHTIVTANASHLCLMRRDSAFAAACRAADLTVADGMSVVWAVRASGQRIPQRLAGIDVMSALLAAAASNDLSVYFLGAQREVVTELAARCRERYPGLKIAGIRDGFFGPHEHEAIIRDIRLSGAHMLFVGMPSPFKEVWCEQNREALAIPVVIGVGGSFDVLAGFIQRAPVWVQSAGFEWLWRLLMEPSRLLRRYLATNSEFMLRATGDIVVRRLSRPKLPKSDSAGASHG